MTDSDELLRVPTPEDVKRLNAFWQAFADGPQPFNISPRNRMDAWVIEQQILSDQRANDRMTKATWALVLATVVEVCVTIGQVVVAVLHR
jgi:hypothetical protein